MCIDFDGHHSGGSSFVYVNDFFVITKIVCIHTGTSSALRKKKTGKESQYIVSRPELDSDPSFGSDRDRGVIRFLGATHASHKLGM